jgi:hypothetical protein
MKIKPNTDFLVKPGEVISVTVQAFNTLYLAGFSNLSSGNWIPVSPPNPEVRKFIAPNVPINSFDIAFAFEPAADPAKYHVTIVGDPAEDTFQEDIPPLPPLPAGRDYRFVSS